MAPSKPAAASSPFAKDEKTLCFHHDMLYEAKILDVRPTEDNQSWQYKIHYKGWKNTWDDWVPQDRVRKFTPENQELARTLHNQMKALTSKNRGQAAPKGKGARANGSDFSSARGSEEPGRHASAAAPGRTGRGRRDYETEPEEIFQTKATVKLLIPDSIKAILVDDWENVTKNQQLVPLPAPRPVNTILEDYKEFEKPKRQPGPGPDILDEVIAGLKEYFNKCLGRILLYRFERAQYIEVREEWAKSGHIPEPTAGDYYGAEHLCRLIVTLPELIAQTNMDTQSVNRLKEELTKLTLWIEKNASTYFAAEYETPAQEYIDRARNA